MKLAHSELERVIEFKENEFNALVVESPSLFRKLILDLTNQMNGIEGKFVLSEENTPIPISKNAEVISDFVTFEINKSALMKKVNSAIEKVALNEEFYVRTQCVLSELMRYIDELTEEFSTDFVYSKLNVSSVLKSVGISLDEEYDSECEKLYDYMELTREFDCEKLFVFVNMRSYFEPDELKKFVNTVIAHKFNILLIDNCQYEILDGERRLTIDKDLCEI